MYLARYLTGEDGKYYYSLGRQLQNQWFEEEQNRQTNPWIIIAGAVQRRHLLSTHPFSFAFDDVMREVNPQLFRDASRYRASDIPALLAKAAMEERSPDRTARGLRNMYIGLREGDVHSIGSSFAHDPTTPEDAALDTIVHATERRMVNVYQATRAVREAGVSVGDALATFERRMARLPLPPMLRHQMNVNWR